MKASGTGHTWGDLDEFPSDAGFWDETVEKRHVSMGSRNL